MKSRPSRIALLALLLSPAASAQLTWSGGGTAGADWDLTTANWTGATTTTWTQGEDAILGTANSQIDLTVPITVDDITTNAAVTLGKDGAPARTLTLAGTDGASDFNGTGTLILANNIAVAGNTPINKSGSGRVFFKGVNTFTGTITMTAGSLQVTNTDSIFGNATNDFVIAGNSSFYTNSGIIFSFNANRSFALDADLVMNGQPNNNRSYTIAGPITGSGKLSLTGGTTDLALTGNNSFSGAVSIAAGSSTKTGSGNTTVWTSNHTRLTIGNGTNNTTAKLGNGNNAVVLNGLENPDEGTTFTGAAATTGPTGSTGSAALRFFRNDYTFNGPISGNGVVEVDLSDDNNTVSATINLTGDNSYSGQTLIRQGALKVASAYDAGTLAGSLAPANLRFDQHAVLIIAGDLDPANSADFTRAVGNADNQVRWTNGGGFAASGADRTVDIGGSGATFSWHSIGTSNALFLSHPDANAKVIFVNPLNLTATAGNRNFRVHNGGAAIDGEVSGPISGGSGVGIQKSDPGTLVLSGANTYDGATQVNEGRLTIADSGAIDSSMRLDPRTTGILDLTAVAPYAMASGRTLTGTGIVTGAVILGGILSPGVIATPPAVNAPGTLTTAALTLGGTATVNIDIRSSGTPATDTLKVTGALDLGSAVLAVSEVAAAPVTLAPATVLKIIDYAGQALTGTFAGQPEGSTITAGPNTFIIHYAVDTNADTIADAVTLSIPSGDAYDTWATAKGLAGADAAFAADPDGDGIRNGLEFVLGGEPNPAHPGANSTNLLPKVSQTAGDMSFTFKRKDVSEGVGTLTFQWSADLAFPPANNVPVGAVDSTTGGITVEVTKDNPDADTDTVVITIPAANASGGKLFGRLEAARP
jgi:autotransporter-associated beta strand protein